MIGAQHLLPVSKGDSIEKRQLVVWGEPTGSANFNLPSPRSRLRVAPATADSEAVSALL
jgi:hypothetical protein